MSKKLFLYWLASQDISDDQYFHHKYYSEKSQYYFSSVNFSIVLDFIQYCGYKLSSNYIDLYKGTNIIYINNDLIEVCKAFTKFLEEDIEKAGGLSSYIKTL